MDSLFVFLQHIVPQHLLSRVTGWLAELRYPIWLKDWVIKRFVDHFDVNMADAVASEPSAYANFNAFFTRELKPGAREFKLEDDVLTCPCDGLRELQCVFHPSPARRGQADRRRTGRLPR